MSRVCPRPCGRLATATVFISISVVQLIAGLILLNSKYVYLLSAPNIWTAASNFTVGILFAVSASVWKSTRKSSFKHATRRKILASLAFSAVILNGTTVSILILGEGNTLLSIHLENHGRHSPKTTASEILAYAYATSVCSPIVCVVIAIVYLSGIWFQKTEQLLINSKKRNVLETDSNAFNWVYESEQRRPTLPKPDLKVLGKLALESSSSSSSDSLGSTFPTRSNSVPSLNDLDTHLNSEIFRKAAPSVGSLIPRLTRQRSQHTEMYTREDASCTRNVTSCSNDSLTSERIRFSSRSPLREYSMEFDSQRNPLKFRIKKRDGAFVLGHRESKIDSHADGLPRVDVKKICKRSPLPDSVFHPQEITVEEPHERFHILDHSQSTLTKSTKQESSNLSPKLNPIKSQYDVIADVHQTEEFQDHEMSPPVSGETVTSSNVLGRFTENQQYSGHAYLRRTSTAVNLNSPPGISSKDTSSGSVHSSDSHNHTLIQKTISGKSSHAYVHDSYANDTPTVPFLLDQTDTNLEPDANVSIGEVVPVRVNTVSRRKLPPKLVPVSIPMVPQARKNVDGSTINNLTAEGVNKFESERKAGLSSFRHVKNSGNKARHRSKSVGKSPGKDVDDIHEQAASSRSSAGMPPMDWDSLITTGDTQLFTSPAHTSGYISAMEENGDQTRQNLFDSSRSYQSPVSSSCAGRSSDGRSTPRKKIRSTQRKIMDRVRTKSDEERIKAIMEQLKSENSAPHEEPLAQLIYDFFFQKVMEQEIKD